MKIAVTNSSTLCTDADVASWCAAITEQLKDWATHWGRRPVSVQFAGKTAPAGYDTIVVLDDPDQAGALGWHSAATGSFPFGRVFARPALTNNITPSSVLSHEALELATDPFVGLWASDQQTPGKLFAVEIGDPVENDGYQINGVTVSNYVFPAWFNATDQTGPWDKMGKTTGPFKMSPHGYVVYIDDAGSHTVFGEQYPTWRRSTKDSPLARTYKRRLHHGGVSATPAWAKPLTTAVHGLQKDMRSLMSDQSKLDADVQKLTDATTAVEKEIADLKAQPAAASLDFAKLDAAVAKLQSDGPAATPAPAPTPAPPSTPGTPGTPAPAPTTPPATPPVGGRHK